MPGQHRWAVRSRPRRSQRLQATSSTGSGWPPGQAGRHQ